MRIRSPKDLGLFLRQQRKLCGMSQIELAQRIRVGRRWVVDIEAGKSTAEVGLVLKALQALDSGIFVQLFEEERPSHARGIETLATKAEISSKPKQAKSSKTSGDRKIVKGKGASVLAGVLKKTRKKKRL